MINIISLQNVTQNINTDNTIKAVWKIVRIQMGKFNEA